MKSPWGAPPPRRPPNATPDDWQKIVAANSGHSAKSHVDRIVTDLPTC